MVIFIQFTICLQSLSSHSPNKHFFKKFILCFLYLHFWCLPGIWIYIYKAFSRYLLKKKIQLKHCFGENPKTKIQCFLNCYSFIVDLKSLHKTLCILAKSNESWILFLKQQVSQQLIMTFNNLWHVTSVLHVVSIYSDVNI